MLVQAHAKQFKIEDLAMSARGKRGALAKAILTMPDEINTIEQEVVLASSYSQTQIEFNSINPFKTSSRHYNCGGKLARGVGNCELCKCRDCDVEVNTHLNAALHIANGGGLV